MVFHGKQVYRCALPPMIAKGLRYEPVRSAAIKALGTMTHRFRAGVCGAIYFLHERDRGLRNGTQEQEFTATNLHTTLVLEPQAPDFSTDAGNSDLIVTTKSPRRLWRQLWATRRRRKITTPRFLFDPDWLTREGTPCHGRSFLDDNS
jgi:hypothetical protein